MRTWSFGWVAVVGGLVLSSLCEKSSPPPAHAAPLEPRLASSPERVFVYGGTFVRGSTRGDIDERPTSRVELTDFEIDRTEVTVRRYRECQSSGACTAAGQGLNCNAARRDREDHPVNCVSWDQATAYCAWVGARLPTETEWEYVARGPESRTYPWGDARPGDQLCWDGDDNDQGRGRRRSTCPVGSHPRGRTPSGVEDMAGNVWEWTSDSYSTSYLAPPDPALRVARGGTWFGYDAADVRSSLRFRLFPHAKNHGVGFRCARSRP